MRKCVLCLLIFCMINMCISFDVLAASADDYVTSTAYNSSISTVSASGSMPVLKNIPNLIFRQKMNDLIEEIYNEKMQEAQAKKIQSVKFEYNAILSGDYLSLVIYCVNTQTGSSTVESVVIDKSRSLRVYMAAVLGANGIAYANKVFDSKIKANKTVRYFNLSPISNESAFYINNSNIYLVFGCGEICAISKGICIFEVPSAKIANAHIPSSACYTKSLYNVKMVPLRTALEKFGYSLSYNSATSTVTIVKGTSSTKVTIGKNSYYKGKQTPRKLEFAPEIVNGTTYVPISFFESILDMLFSVDFAGNVTLSRYSL